MNKDELNNKLAASLEKVGITNIKKQTIDAKRFEKLITLLNNDYNELEDSINNFKCQFEKLKIVVDNTPCTISWINNRLEYEGVNQSLLEFTNQSKDSYQGKQLGFQSEDRYFYEFAKELFDSNEINMYKELKSTLNGETRTFWVVGSKYAANTEAVIIGIETTELHQTRARLAHSEKLVEIDDLTGLYNMRSVFDRIKHEILRGQRTGKQTAVVMMDMDHFKNVNDNHDHLFGSFVLAEVGGIIKRAIRKIDLGARYGGDEFLIVLAEADEEGVKVFCERLRKTIEDYHFKRGKDEMKLTPSIGYAIGAPGSKVVNERGLVRIADKALYQAKNEGRNCVRGFCEVDNADLFNELNQLELDDRFSDC